MSQLPRFFMCSNAFVIPNTTFFFLNVYRNRFQGEKYEYIGKLFSFSQCLLLLLLTVQLMKVFNFISTYLIRSYNMICMKDCKVFQITFNFTRTALTAFSTFWFALVVPSSSKLLQFSNRLKENNAFVSKFTGRRFLLQLKLKAVIPLLSTGHVAVGEKFPSGAMYVHIAKKSFVCGLHPPPPPNLNLTQRWKGCKLQCGLVQLAMLWFWNKRHIGRCQHPSCPR